MITMKTQTGTTVQLKVDVMFCNLSYEYSGYEYFDTLYKGQTVTFDIRDGEIYDIDFGIRVNCFDDVDFCHHPEVWDGTNDYEILTNLWEISTELHEGDHLDIFIDCKNKTIEIS